MQGGDGSCRQWRQRVGLHGFEQRHMEDWMYLESWWEAEFDTHWVHDRLHLEWADEPWS